MIIISESVNKEVQWQFEPENNLKEKDLNLDLFVLKHAKSSLVLWLLSDYYNCGNYYSEEY